MRTGKNNKCLKSSTFNKATNHEVTKKKSKIAKVANATIRQMLHCSRFLLGNFLSTFRASFLLFHLEGAGHKANYIRVKTFIHENNDLILNEYQ